MSRYIPTQPHDCHLCSARFTITSAFDASQSRVVSQPTACPRCGAPLRYAGGKDIGAAKNLVLTLKGLPVYREQFGTAREFLLKHSRTARDIDDYLALVERLDFAEWERDQRLAAARGVRLSEDELTEHKVMPIVRAEAASGELFEALRAAADEAKAVLNAERAKHLV